MDLCSVFTLIGVLWAARQALYLILFLWRWNRSLDQYKYGWAVVTGATDGIGKAICEELLSKGFRVAMISRSQNKLESVKSELETRFAGAKVEVIQADFTLGCKDIDGFYSDLSRKIERLGEVSVLVNNVGVMHWKKFENTSVREMEEMMAVNVLPQTMLTRSVLPGMEGRFRTTGKRSLIIDLSSTASIVPLPYLAVYGATKAYNTYLSQALSNEVSKGITVLSVLPGMVATNMPKMNNIPPQPGLVHAQPFAKYILQQTAQGTTSGHPLHMVLSWLLRYVLDNPFGLSIVHKTSRDLERIAQKSR